MERPRTIARGVDFFPVRTPTLPPATHTNSYALGDREVLLVEPSTPYDDERRAWLDWARAFPGQGRRLVGVVMTHHHVDHVGGAEHFSRELGVPLWAHEATAQRLPALTIARRLVDGETITLDGEVPQRWEVLHTPGHAPGHVCLHERARGIAVLGDMVAGKGTILIEPKDGDMRAYLEQLDRLAALELDLALPAHGEPIDRETRRTPTRLLQLYIEHRLLRERMVVGALAKAPKEGASLDALLPGAYGDTSRLLWPLARLSLEAHLIKLARDGRARRSDAGWALSA